MKKEKVKKEKVKKEKIKKEKIKKPKNSFLIIINILTFACTLALIFLIYSIYKISGIENEIRYIVMGVLLLVNMLLQFIIRKITKKEKKVPYIISIIILLLLTIGQGFVGYFVYKTYSSIDSINKNKITYSTDIIVYKDSKILSEDALKNKEIGIVVDETSIDGYIIGTEIIKELKLQDTATIVEYDNISNLVGDLYDGKIDAAIVSSNYASMLDSMEKFEKIEEEVKSIYNRKKTLTKNQVAKLTGDDTIILNSSNSIDKPFTILVMGIDSTLENLDSNATGNGDALMLVTFNPKTLNATILSIPRDTYVSIPCLGGIENKITHAAWGGESCMIRSVQNLTGINIDYYVKINFKGVVKLVDILGGITVNVPESLDGVCEQNSNRSSSKGSRQCFKAGTQTLTGEQALAMARHRKTLATGDFERGLNQQIVVQGILNQLKNIKSANQALELLEAISNNMDTNFTTKQILSFYDIAKNILETSNSQNLINMQQLYIAGSGQMIYDERAGMVLYNFIPNGCSLKDDVTTMKRNLNQAKVTWTKSMDFDIEETFAMSIIGRYASCGTDTYTLLPSVVGKTESNAKTILQGYGLTVEVEEKEITDGSYNDGIVISQSHPQSKRLDKITDKKITIVVAKVVDENDTESEENSEDNMNQEGSTDNTTNNENNNENQDNNSNNNDNENENNNNNENDDTTNNEDNNENQDNSTEEPSAPTTPTPTPTPTTGCSDSAYDSKDTCEAAGGTWTE